MLLWLPLHRGELYSKVYFSTGHSTSCHLQSKGWASGTGRCLLLARGEKTLCSMGQLFISLLLQARSTIFFSWSRDWSVSTQRVQGLHTHYHLLKPISLSFPILHGKHEHTVCMKGNAQKQIQKTEKTPAKKLCCTHSFSQKRQEIKNMINIGSSTPW